MVHVARVPQHTRSPGRALSGVLGGLLGWVVWLLAASALGRPPWLVEEGAEGLTAAAQCYALAASSPDRQGQLISHHLHTKICDKTIITAFDLL